MLEVWEDFPLPRHCLTRWFESRGPVYLLQMTSVGLQVVPQQAQVIGMTPHWAVRRRRPRGSGGPVQWHRARLSPEVSSDSFVPFWGEGPRVWGWTSCRAFVHVMASSPVHVWDSLGALEVPVSTVLSAAFYLCDQMWGMLIVSSKCKPLF